MTYGCDDPILFSETEPRLSRLDSDMRSVELMMFPQEAQTATWLINMATKVQ